MPVNLGGEQSTAQVADTPKVLVFCLAHLGQIRGGFLWAQNLLSCLAAVSGMRCIVISCWTPDARDDNESFVKRLGLDHTFIPIWSAAKNPACDEHFDAAALMNALRDKYYFLGERLAATNKHIDIRVVEIIGKLQPRAVIVDGIWSALYVPSIFSLETPRCLVVTDNDVAFHRSHRSQGGPLGKDLLSVIGRGVIRRGNYVASFRFKNFVNRIHKRCSGIVSLTHADIPHGLRSDVIKAVLPPLLSESAQSWSYTGSRSVLFVGNIAHFPNRQAVEWICVRLAPELLRLDSRIRINIVGARPDHFQYGSRLKNVNLMGISSREDVILRMTSDDIFIAPIANNFGAKLKLAECASHGMPFLATREALSGLPFLTFIPTIELDSPRAAAHIIVDYLHSPSSLAGLSDSIRTRMREARAEQATAWKAFLDNWIRPECAETSTEFVMPARDSCGAE